MGLFLVQHGEARTEQEDPDRPLTAAGAADVRRVARAAADAHLVAAARIVHSGKTRARQTAEVWSEALGVPVVEADGLAPLDDPHIWASRVTGESAGLMLVGHLPHLGRLAGLLLVDDADRPVVAFAQGGLVALDRSGSDWAVSLVLPPIAAGPTGAAPDG